jgi:hypothetical protein
MKIVVDREMTMVSNVPARFVFELPSYIGFLDYHENTVQ